MSSVGDEKNNMILSNSSLIAFIFAFILVQLYFISPIYFIFKYNKKFIEMKHIPFLQIFLNLLNCITYVVIAETGTGDIQNLITNLIGSCLCLIVIIYLYVSISKKLDSNYILYFFIVLNIIFQIYYLNIFMYLSLNIGTYFAFKEKKPDRIPILSAFLGLLSSIGWTIYSATLENVALDNITFFSNIFSFLVIIFTIVSYFYLDRCNKSEINEMPSNVNTTL